MNVPKFFNTAGPIKLDIHYNVDPLSRIDLSEIEMLIQQQKYFVLYAPRQTGKTSCLLALRDYLNAIGYYWAVYANVEAGQAMRNNVEVVNELTASVIAEEAALIMGTSLPVQILRQAIADAPASRLVSSYLSALCGALDRPLVLFIDEIDSLVGDSLVSICIIPEMIYRAEESIIYRRDTHIDILIDKLREPRVCRVIGPILSGEEGADESLMPTDDIQYVADMGLIVLDKPRRIANAIYREIIPRELTWDTQSGLTQQSAWYINPDNSINMEKLLTDFQQFFRQNADSWIERFDYKESGPQLLLQAFLQRGVNGGGYIDREYGLGRGRTDLLITKPLTDGYGGPLQRIVLELKIKRGDTEKTIIEGLKQTVGYMDTCGGVINEGHFILFNRDKGASWDSKIWHRSEQLAGRKIEVWGM